MSQDKIRFPCPTFSLRAPVVLDALVEEIARVELRTKTAVLTLALTEYAEHHHFELFQQYAGGAMSKKIRTDTGVQCVSLREVQPI